MISADISAFLSDKLVAWYLETLLDVIGGECTRFLPVLMPQLVKVYKEYAGASRVQGCFEREVGGPVRDKKGAELASDLERIVIASTLRL